MRRALGFELSRRWQKGECPGGLYEHEAVVEVTFVSHLLIPRSRAAVNHLGSKQRAEEKA